MTDQGRKFLFVILQSIELVEGFLSTISDYQEYIEDLKTQSAVERQLGIIGEAVNKFDKMYPEATLNSARKIIDCEID